MGVGVGAAADEDERLEVLMMVLLALVLELSGVEVGVLLGELLLDDVIVEVTGDADVDLPEEAEDDITLLVDTEDELEETEDELKTFLDEAELDCAAFVEEILDETAATDEVAVTPDDDRLEDKTPHFPNSFWQPSPQ